MNHSAKPTQRITEAIAILQEPKTRKRRSDLQGLCKIWAVAQKSPIQKKRSVCELEDGLEETVVRDTNRLRKLQAQHGHVSSVQAALGTTASGAEQTPPDKLKLENDAAFGTAERLAEWAPIIGRC